MFAYSFAVRRTRDARVLLLVVFSSAIALALSCGDDDETGAVVTPAEPAPGPSTEEVLARHHHAWDAGARTSAIEEGRAVLVEQQCNRCHTIDDVEPGARPKHCTSCHQWLKGLTPDHRTFQKLSKRYGRDIIERYQRNIDHFQEVPDLTKIGHRLHPDWIDEFIADPYDLRPAMHENMIRTNLSDEDRQKIVRYFAAVAEVADPYADEGARVHEAPTRNDDFVREGQALFSQRGCTNCHTLGNIDTGKPEAVLRAQGNAGRLAPNLRFTRDRMSEDVLVAWIMRPRDFHPETLMPQTGITYPDAQRLAQFILFADPELEPQPPIAQMAVPAVLDREVGWAEVKDRVLGRICVHCHMNDHERDRGPGNEGGFGWPGNQLAMRTYEMLIRGAYDPETQERYSVLTPREEGGLSPIIEVMLLRRLEERRDRVHPFHDYERPEHSEHELGMPMGLPSIPDEEVALVRTWIAQGCKGPTEVTGMGGIDDGFLVPDGPLADNDGCELRQPSEERPSWTMQEPPPWMRKSGASSSMSSTSAMSAMSATSTTSSMSSTEM